MPIAITPFIRRRDRKVNMDRATAHLVGWLATLEAWRQGDEQDRPQGEEWIEPDLSDTLHFLLQLAEHYLQENALEFWELVRKKRVLYRLERSTSDKRCAVA